MPKDPTKKRFDAVLTRMLNTPPVQHKELVGTPPAEIDDDPPIMFSRAVPKKSDEKKPK